ncbi:MAG: hypothetical protein H6711_29770 [Myxococcales bacterium]|nr:hypothetical protein [Myxococcales bacterium]
MRGCGRSIPGPRALAGLALALWLGSQGLAIARPWQLREHATPATLRAG